MTPRLQKSALLCALSLALFIGLFFANQFAHDSMLSRLAHDKASLHQTEMVIERYKDRQNILTQSAAALSVTERDAILAPVNRVMISELLPKLARTSKFDHAHFDLSAEESADNIAPQLKRSLLTIEAFAPNEFSVQSFFDRLTNQLPGRLDWQSLTLTREQNTDGGVPYLKVSAKIIWLSNGSENRESP